MVSTEKLIHWSNQPSIKQHSYTDGQGIASLFEATRHIPLVGQVAKISKEQICAFV